MEFNKLLEELREAILIGDDKKANEMAKLSVEKEFDPQKVVDEGIRLAMDEVGELFASGEYFLPDLIRSGEATKAVISELEPVLVKEGSSSDSEGKVVIGTVQGDIHEIGKTLVSTMITAGGFKVIDLGVDVSTEKFLETVQSENVKVLGLSALLTTTMPFQKVVIDSLKDAGLRDKVKVIIGGAPTNADWADEIGADAYCDNAMEAVRVVREIMG